MPFAERTALLEQKARDFNATEVKANQMRAYIECTSDYAGGAVWGSALHDSDLFEIGEFTRGNIERWLASYGGPCIECCGVQDFHAVCGDIDIPWREERNAQEYKRLNPPLATARWRWGAIWTRRN